MGKKQPDESNPQKPNVFQTVAATIAGILAVKLAGFVVTTGWRLVTREDPPQVDQAAPIAKKAAWIAIFAAATGASRQIVRDYIKPHQVGPA